MTQDGERMITNDSAWIVVVNVARVLVHQMLDLILAVKHQHQCNNRKGSTSTRFQIADVALGVFLDGCDKLLDIATLDGLSCLGIYCTGIAVGRIMREVATDDEKIFSREIGLQHLSHAL